MPSYYGTGAENLRAHEQTPASSVPEQAGTGGRDVGGTANLRANATAKPSEKPAAFSGNGRSTQGQTFTDDRV